MPFDGPTPTTKPDLRILSDVLRGGPAHPMWPTGFVWDYTSCFSCAMGLAAELWDEVSPCTYSIARHTGMPLSYATHIFCGLGHKTHPGQYMWDITPADVADAIDAYLASRSDA